MLQGMLKVAALEAPHLAWQHASASALQAPGGGASAASVGAADAFGSSQEGGALLLPLLLAAATAAASPAPPSSAAPARGACLVTGGFGALGALVSAHHLSASGGAEPPHVVLLGRSIRVLNPTTELHQLGTVTAYRSDEVRQRLRN